MKKMLIAYWSATGNTQAMAEAMAEGARQIADVEVTISPIDEVSPDVALEADLLALGCPAMGNEQLEESEMEPFVEALHGQQARAKSLLLFGSYDWGDGQWLREWDERMKAAGFSLLEEGIAVHNEPDEAALTRCQEVGKKLASQ